MIKRFRRLVAALLIPFVLVWSIMIPRQAFAFAPVGAAPIAIVGTLASGVVVPIVVGAVIAGVAYWAFKDLVSLDEVRVPAVDGAAGAVPPPVASGSVAATETPIYSYTVSGGCSSATTSLSDACGQALQSCMAAENSTYGKVTMTCSDTQWIGGWYEKPNGAPYQALIKTVSYGQTGSTYSCPGGYTSSGSDCILSNPHEAVADGKKDYARSGTSLSPIAGDQAGSLSATTMTTTNVDDTVLVVGKDSSGNAMQGKIIALSSGGSKVELKTQMVDAGGQTYVETQTFQTSSAGDVVSATKTAAQTSLTYDPTTKTYTENPNPSGSYSPTPATQQAIQFPSDYARQGEAASAAQSISNTLGPKIDAITNTGDDPVDPLLPEESIFNDAFFADTFSNLLGWQLPAHTSECPTGSFTWNGGTYAIDSHCQLINSHFGGLSGAMAVVWTVAALFLVLRA